MSTDLINQVILIVADHFRLEPRDLRSPRRTKRLVEPRWLAMTIAGRLTGAFDKVVAGQFSCGDCAVAYARRRIDERRRSDIALAGILADLERRCTVAIACPTLEPCLINDAANADDIRILTALADRLRRDWDGTMVALDGFLNHSPDDPALRTPWSNKGEHHAA